MKQLFLCFLLLFGLNCYSSELKEINTPNNIFFGLWNVTEVSIDQGKSYSQSSGTMSFDISPKEVILSNETHVAIIKVFETTTKGIYLNVIYLNSGEILAITRKNNDCLIAIFFPDGSEMIRVVAKSYML